MSAALKMVLVVENLLVSSLPAGTDVSSRVECVSLCHFKETCSSIFYDISSKKCYLVDTVYMDAEFVAISANMQYMVWVTEGCGNGYTWHRALNLCYEILSMPSVWQDAETLCIQDGGHLVKVDNSDINDFINRIANSKGYVWLGGNDIAVEGQWKWTDNSQVQLFYWDTNEPNDNNHVENCLFVNPFVQNPVYTWHDAPCDYTHSAVCQLPVSPTSAC